MTMVKKNESRFYNCGSQNHIMPDFKKAWYDVVIITNWIYNQKRSKTASLRVRILKKCLEE